jgi:uncharacterized protein YjiK
MKSLLLAKYLSISLPLLGACSSAESTSSIRFPYQWLGPQGFGGTINQDELVEPSGIGFHPGRGTLFVVSDEGFVYEMTTDGVLLNQAEVPGDLEGVAIDPSSALVYVLAEGEDVILEIEPETLSVVRRFPISRAYGGVANFLEKQTDDFDNGCESIAFVPDVNHPEGGTFYVANQWDPSCIMEIGVPLRSASGEGGEASILRVFEYTVDDPAAMYYDHASGTLNVVSDADNILVELTLDGEFLRSYAFLGNDQEGLAVDSDGFLYIAEDSGGVVKVKDLRNKQAPATK